MAEVAELRDLAHEGRGTAFAQIKINPEALAFVMPPADGVILTTRFRQSVLGVQLRGGATTEPVMPVQKREDALRALARP